MRQNHENSTQNGKNETTSAFLSFVVISNEKKRHKMREMRQTGKTKWQKNIKFYLNEKNETQDKVIIKKNSKWHKMRKMRTFPLLTFAAASESLINETFGHLRSSNQRIYILKSLK